MTFALVIFTAAWSIAGWILIGAATRTLLRYLAGRHTSTDDAVMFAAGLYGAVDCAAAGRTLFAAAGLATALSFAYLLSTRHRDPTPPR